MRLRGVAALLVVMLGACAGESDGGPGGVDGGVAGADVPGAADVGAASDVTGADDAVMDALGDVLLDARGDARGDADATAVDATVAVDAADDGTGGDAGQPPEDAGAPDVHSPDYPLDDVLRLNHLQALGTHNSYHVQPPDTTLSDWAYSHEPLDVQLGAQGVRQFELDVHLEPPVGFTVKHIPILDGVTTCETLHECLTVVLKWSDAHPGHHAIFILIEPKDEVDPVKLKGHIAELDAAILEVWDRSRVLTPDDVRGGFPTLREAIIAEGWPTLGQTRGKLVVTLLDSGAHRDEYLVGHPSLEGRVMFADGGVNDAWAGILLLDDPVGDADAIAEAVSAGFIVRTRGDTDHGTLVEKQVGRRDAALKSGAHMISSDYPAPVEGIDYVCEIPGGTPSRCNPVTAPAECSSADIEALGL